ncbi:UNVERIFIED_CONTAM: hypothetical protein GTU68_061702 [Idotea baltica]|nr:hypothetical protein [Idotea baltica]
MAVTILAIESSCDDTSAAVCKDGVVLSNLVATQEVHKEWGGVVPELASRAHEQNIVPVVDAALKKAGVTKNELSAVAFTLGPGLMGSLLVGTSFGKSMAQGLGIPIITVNHMKAHVLAHFIDKPKPQFPFLCLTVSGGHTQIVLVKGYLDMEVIGSTIDDAAGEAFDKAAKMFGLPYPGGPLIDKYAQLGDDSKFEFARPKVQGINFSFSGVKTSVLYKLRKWQEDEPNFSLQKTIVDILIGKLKKAAKQTGIKEIAIAGGVSANSGLRERLKAVGLKERWNTYIPQFQYCTDNAGMIAITAYHQFLSEDFADLDVIPNPRLKV